MCSYNMCTWNINQALYRKIEFIMDYIKNNDIAVCCLQETGNFLVDNRFVRSRGYAIIDAPCKHRGVAIIVRSVLFDRIVRKWYTDCGRAVAVLINIGKNANIMIISVYAPTALDVKKVDSKVGEEASQLYSTILQWVSETPVETNVVVMGDLNETLSSVDRSSRDGGGGRFVGSLLNNDFVDVYRQFHSDDNGYTCFTPRAGGMIAKSRIDYVLYRAAKSRSTSFSISSISIDSHHHTRATINTPHTPLLISSLFQSIHSVPNQYVQQIPDLLKASPEQKRVAAEWMELWCMNNISSIEKLDVCGKGELEMFVSSFISAASNACTMLPKVGGSKVHNNTTKTFNNRQKYISPSIGSTTLHRQLCRARRLLRAFYGGVKLSDRNYIYINSIIWSVRLYVSISFNSAYYDWYDKPTVWIEELSKLIKLSLQKRRADEVTNSIREDNDVEFNKNPTAFVNRLMHGDASSATRSVIDPETKTLKSDEKEVKEVFHKLFSARFSSPPHRDESIQPSWVKERYAFKDRIDPQWYDDLMDDVSESEIAAALRDTPYATAPGADGVSSGVWKMLCKSDIVRETVAAFTSARFRLRCVTSVGRHSVIHPIHKHSDGNKEVNNIRPITLQSSLIKIGQKVLANRLGLILSSFRILNPAQEGFLPGGDAKQCVDVMLDIIEHSLERDNRECYSIAYDLMAAYDSVRHDDLLRSLHRLRLPPSFIELIRDSLTGLTCSVRTAYGNTQSFPIHRGIPQGDPLAPILFVIFLDVWHDGFLATPGCIGYKFSKNAIASKGYADDCIIVSSKQEDLHSLHKWSNAWADWHQVLFHPKKTTLMGRGSDGKLMVNNNMYVKDSKGSVNYLDVQPIDKSIDYLGSKLQMNLGSSSGVTKINNLIHMWCRGVERSGLSVNKVVWIFNMYMIPAISYSLSFVQPSAAEARKWDYWVCCCISRMIGHRGARWVKHEALAAITGLTLPSQHEKVIKVSETFIRLNRNHGESWLCRQRWMAFGARSLGTRKLAADMGIVFNRNLNPPTSSAHSLPPSSSTVSSCVVAGVVCRIVLGSSSVWGIDSKDITTINICTDGSLCGGVSSWSVCYIDDVLLGNIGVIPKEGKFVVDEKYDWITHLSGRTSTSFANGIYDAELEAVARALLSVAATNHVHIHCDSQSVVAAIKRARANCKQVNVNVSLDVECINVVEWYNDRQHLRSAGRNWLHLIVRIMYVRQRYGGRTRIGWVRAHTGGSSAIEVGNRCADEFAKRAAKHDEKVQRIPIEVEDAYVTMIDKPSKNVITSDCRRECQRRFQVQNTTGWSKSHSQSRFSHPLISSKLLFTTVSRLRPSLCGFVIRVLADIVQWRKVDDSKEVVEMCCKECKGVKADVVHLMQCVGVRHLHRRCIDDIVKLAKADLSSWNAGNVRFTSIHTLLHSLGFIHASIENDDVNNIIGSVVGGFDNTKALGGLLGLEMNDKVNRQSLIDRIRVRLVMNVYSCYRVNAVAHGAV